MTGRSTNVAVGSTTPSTGGFAILVDVSTAYYSYYHFNMTTFNRIEGVQWTYRKGGTLTGSGTYFLAHRTKSPSMARGSHAPGVTKAMPIAPARDFMDAIRATRVNVGGEEKALPNGMSIDEVRQMAKDLQGRLEAENR